MDRRNGSHRGGRPGRRLTGFIQKAVWSAAWLLLCMTPNIRAQTTSDTATVPPPRQYLFGDWGVERTAMANKGVTFDFFYVADLQANPVGGLTQTQVGWGRIRGTMDVDFGKLKGWNGFSFHVTGLWQFGGNLGADIGVLANPSGLVSSHTTRLDSFWLQQAFLDNRVFVRADSLRV